MSKNDVPFHRVISSFVDGLVLPKELGINGISYSYGGSNINFDTSPSYPIVSVIYLLSRKEPSIAFSSFYHSRTSSAFLKPYYSKKKSSSCHNPKQFSATQWKPSSPSSSPSTGSMSSSPFSPPPSKNISQPQYPSSQGSTLRWSIGPSNLMYFYHYQERYSSA